MVISKPQSNQENGYFSIQNIKNQQFCFILLIVYFLMLFPMLFSTVATQFAVVSVLIIRFHFINLVFTIQYSVFSFHLFVYAFAFTHSKTMLQLVQFCFFHYLIRFAFSQYVSVCFPFYGTRKSKRVSLQCLKWIFTKDGWGQLRA